MWGVRRVTLRHLAWRFGHQQRTSRAQALGDRRRLIAAERHLLQLRDNPRPLWRGRDKARIARQQLLEDVYLELLPGGAVASVGGIVVVVQLVVGVARAIVDAYGERLRVEVAAHELLQPGALGGAGAEAENAAEAASDHRRAPRT